MTYSCRGDTDKLEVINKLKIYAAQEIRIERANQQADIQLKKAKSRLEIDRKFKLQMAIYNIKHRGK